MLYERRHIGVPMHRATVLNMPENMFGDLLTGIGSIRSYRGGRRHDL